MSTSSARSAKTLYPAALIFSRRSSSVVMRSGSTEWMRNGSMIVLKRSGTAAPMLVRRRFLSDEADRLGYAAGPGLAVSRKHYVRFDSLNSLQRLARPREVAPEGRELRPGLSREHVQRRERIAYEEHLPCGQMQRGACLAVARDSNDAWRAGYVEGRPVAECGNLEDRRRTKHPLRQRETDEAEGRKSDAQHLLVLGFRFAASNLRVELVHAHRHAPFAAQALGEADVIYMGVGEHECSNVRACPTHRGEFARQIVPVARRAGIDDRDLAAVLEQIAVHEARADAMDTGNDPHRLRFGSAVAATVS